MCSVTVEYISGNFSRKNNERKISSPYKIPQHTPKTPIADVLHLAPVVRDRGLSKSYVLLVQPLQLPLSSSHNDSHWLKTCAPSPPLSAPQ